MYLYIYIYIYIYVWPMYLHSTKGGAVETGCNDVYDAMYKFTI